MHTPSSKVLPNKNMVIKSVPQVQITTIMIVAKINVILQL